MFLVSFPSRVGVDDRNGARVQKRVLPVGNLGSFLKRPGAHLWLWTEASLVCVRRIARKKLPLGPDGNEPFWHRRLPSTSTVCFGPGSASTFSIGTALRPVQTRLAASQPVLSGACVPLVPSNLLLACTMIDGYIMSPDTVSSLFPDRPIRPLPKRRLRERLSPEVAQSIKYPPSTHDTIPLFYYPPYTLKEERSGSIATESAAPLQHIRRPNLGASFGSLRNGVGPGVLEEEQALVRSTLVARSPPEIFSRAARNPSRLDQPRPAEPQPPPSSTSSVDGYDSFENTNNKKKRKIPSAGDSAINAAHSLNSEISSIAISTGGHSPTSDVHGASGYVAPGAYVPNSQGFSGPGRGRLGRSRNGRSPLRALPDGNNVWPARSSKAGVSPWTSPQEGGGIISSAIANAEKLPSRGQENVSLLQQHSAIAKTTPASAQFTFTCDPQVPGTVQWPGHPNKHTAAPQMASNAPNGVNHEVSSKAAGAEASQSPRKPRGGLEQKLNNAARRRERIAAEAMKRQPPKAEDVWICQFCEYNNIFRKPPSALIRDYEIKDRRRRKEEADRKRLLEKAKAKNRKGKKNGQVTTKASSGAQHMSDQGPAGAAGDQDAPPMHQGPSRPTQSGEHEDDCEGEQARPPSEHAPTMGDDGGGAIPTHIIEM
ncbi:hypothetical protein G6O67_001992 [Ophiocordyceps sinensis]|uniref:Uncharacterized protein n=1 Tax=Ophiocordyceps sinensis TaxID=72228 RepID=A0A8H4PTA2_9HYPO|nr:hypothetical protein G6O67_001992 [Ophiocordyceps sinensis]